MPQREEKADRDRPLAVLHKLARYVVDRRDMVGIERVPQAERVSEQRGAEQHRIGTELQDRRGPRERVESEQKGEDTDDWASQIHEARKIAAYRRPRGGKWRHQGHQR